MIFLQSFVVPRLGNTESRAVLVLLQLDFFVVFPGFVAVEDVARDPEVDEEVQRVEAVGLLGSSRKRVERRVPQGLGWGQQEIAGHLGIGQGVARGQEIGQGVRVRGGRGAG